MFTKRQIANIKLPVLQLIFYTENIQKIYTYGQAVIWKGSKRHSAENCFILSLQLGELLKYSNCLGCSFQGRPWSVHLK